MPRSVKHGGKKKKRYIIKKNFISAKKRSLKRKKNTVYCDEVANEWNKNLTIKQNLEAMGLVYDINKAMKLLPENNAEVEEMDVEDVSTIQSISEQQKKKGEKVSSKSSGDASTKAISALEKAVADAKSRRKEGRKFRLLQRDIEFCVYLIRRYGDDYEAMSRDSKNIFQNSPLQIQRKITTFKKSPEYSTYFKNA